jgi:hypothetical protein
MDGTTTECAAFDETVVFLSHFKDLRDPRQQGKVCYPLDEVLLLCLFAVLAGAECFTEIALFGVKKLKFLRRFRPFMDGTPAIISAISWPFSMLSNSHAALLRGSPR